jgi:vacuolar-type H+-ATPase subunit H
MPKQRQRPRQLDSLIPAIKTEERRLDDLLTEARARAEQIVRDSQAEAAARIEATRRSQPELLRAEREARWPALEEKAAAAAADEEARAQAMEKRARAALEETVKFIVSLVWPGESRP